MKVKLVTQVMSNKVADALLYLNDAANVAPDEDFKTPQGLWCDCGIFKMFQQFVWYTICLLNSCNLLSQDYNAPFQSTNKQMAYIYFWNMQNYT